jgi:peroxiredoxin
MSMKIRSMLTLILAGLLTLGLACEQPQDDGDDEAEAVEAEGEEAEGEEAEGEEGAAKTPDEEANEEVATATVGEPAPEFELTDEAGKTHKLSDYRGKTVVLEWFNPGCPYVVRHHEEEKTSAKTIEAVDSDDLVWLAVDSTNVDEYEDSGDWKKKWNIDFPILQDRSGEVGKLYEAKTTPHMFVIDPDGVLQFQGGIDDDPRGQKKVDERQNYVLQALQALQNAEDVENTEPKPYGCSVKYDS